MSTPAAAQTIAEFYAANIALEREYIPVYAAYPVKKGEEIRVYEEGVTCGWNIPAPGDGYLLSGVRPDNGTSGVFMTRKQLEEETLDMAGAGFAVPRRDMPKTATLHKMKDKTYSYSETGRGGATFSGYRLQAHFNPPAGIQWCDNIEYRTVALRGALAIRGIIVAEDQTFSDPSGWPHRVKAGSIIYPDAADITGYSTGSPDFARYHLRQPIITPPGRQLPAPGKALPPPSA